MRYTAEALQNLFKNKFDCQVWQRFLLDFFAVKHLLLQPERLDASTPSETGYFLGRFTTDDKYHIGLFYFDIGSSSVIRKKIGLRNLVKSFLSNNTFDAALAVFNDGSMWRLSFICDLAGEATAAKRFSYVFGDINQAYRTPIQRFMELQEAGISFATMKTAFSVEALSKQFYNELFDWFQWSLSEEIGVTFPNAEIDGKKNIEERMIRLITRLMFVWFIKQKKLVPEQLFKVDTLNDILKTFDPYSVTEGNYYNAILQNLFFATLNNEIGKRAFATEHRGPQNQAEDYGIKTLFRNPKNDTWFKIGNEKVLQLFSAVPFLNGGLFECLDKEQPDSHGRIVYSDGFSREAGRQRRAFLPNALFFGTKASPDRGLIPLLSRYNFTVEENSTNDADIALDPELLGKVFENLLGAYNPETRETARNQSGSFYTPREIVNYMVDVSLKAYLDGTVKTSLLKQLFAQDELPEELQNDPDTRQAIANRLKTIKVLDPACGSGAFPMGILNRLVTLLQRIDPAATSAYEQKLHLIENCIYGVDIQTIAVQISKLRFFISLICEQEPDFSNPAGNYGIQPLPNLETKFVAANTLVAKIPQDNQLGLFEDPEIQKTKDILHNIRHKHFSAKNTSDKKKFRLADKENREKLALLLENNGFFAPADARQLASWNPYDQNETSLFFDPEWMFGEEVKDGFDVVIGNPPYIQLQNNGGELAELYKNCKFTSFARTGDIYCLFYERGFQLLKAGGHLCFITSNKWMRAGYGESLRKFLAEKTNPKILIDFAGQKIFESATVDTNILLFQKAPNTHKTRSCVAKAGCRDDLSGFIRQHSMENAFNTSDSWVILNPIEQSIKAKIEKIGKPLKEWDIKIYRGILTGCNEAFIIDAGKRKEILANCATQEERKRTDELIRPILRGRDIKRYGYNFANLYLIASHNGIPGKKIPRINIDDYPAVKRHLDSFWPQISKRSDMGDTPYNLRSCAYWEDFSEQKIIYPNMTKYLPFLWDNKRFLTNQKCFIITGKHLGYLTAFLNSSLFKYCYRDAFPELQGGTRELSKIFFDKLAVAQVTDAQNAEFTEMVQRVQSLPAGAERKILEIKIDRMVFKIHCLSNEECAQIGFIEIV